MLILLVRREHETRNWPKFEIYLLENTLLLWFSSSFRLAVAIIPIYSFLSLSLQGDEIRCDLREKQKLRRKKSSKVVLFRQGETRSK